MEESNEEGYKNVLMFEAHDIQLGDEPKTIVGIIPPFKAKYDAPKSDDHYSRLYAKLEAAGLDMPVVLTVFQTALGSYADAARCYKSEIWDPAVAACRAAIDNAVSESLTRKKTKGTGFLI